MDLTAAYILYGLPVTAVVLAAAAAALHQRSAPQLADAPPQNLAREREQRSAEEKLLESMLRRPGPGSPSTLPTKLDEKIAADVLLSISKVLAAGVPATRPEADVSTSEEATAGTRKGDNTARHR